MFSADAVQDLAIQALNLTLMFSVGLELDLVRLRAALRRRGLLLGVTLLNFVAVPLLGLATAHAIALPDPVRIGLVLAAVCPGGGTGTLLTRTAAGDLELSVVLLGIFTVLAVPLVPALTVALVPGESVSLGPLLRTLVVFQLLPLGVGLGLRRTRPPLAARAIRLARPLSNGIFGALVLGLLVTKGHLVPEVGIGGLAADAIVVVGSLALPLALSATPADRAALSLTSGVRNLSLALLLSSAFFSSLTTLSVLTYGLVMYLVGVPIALVLRRGSG